MPALVWLSWLVIGLLTSWLAWLVSSAKDISLTLSLMVGVLGGLVGGYLYLVWVSPNTPHLYEQAAMFAFIGAALANALVHLVVLWLFKTVVFRRH